MATGTVAAGTGITVTGNQYIIGSGLTITNTIGYPFVGNATNTLIAFNGGLSSASTTLTGNFVFANATGTNATTTNFAVTGTASTTALIVSNAGGVAGCATFDTVGTISNTHTACGSGSSSYPFALTGNATSTLTQFNGGLTAYASTTIGSGTQIGGLTISGGATTTGNSYLAGNVGIGTQPDAVGALNVGGAVNLTMQTNAFNTTSIYTALVIGSTTGASAGNGGLYAIGRFNKANEPFAALSGWDDASNRQLYFGGGGWQTPEATEQFFYTATTYNENNNAALKRGYLAADGSVYWGGSITATHGGTGATLSILGTGNVGVGTTSPLALLTVATPPGATGSVGNLFMVASSTPTATTTLFSVSNTGSTTLFQIPSALLTTNAAGTIVGTSSLGVAYGGTGSTTLGAILAGGGSSIYSVATGTVAAGTGITVTGNQYIIGSGLTITNTIGYPFTATNNATGTLTQFNGGLTAFASSTIGNGTAGLTISGNSTTTGNSYFASNVGIGTTSPFARLSIHANNGDTATTLFAIGSSTATATTTLFSILNTGNVGIGTSSPFAALSIYATASSTNRTLFAIASTSNVAGVFSTSTLFSISNIGVINTNPSGTTSVLTMNGQNFLTGSLRVGGFGSVYLGVDAGASDPGPTGNVFSNVGIGYQALTAVTGIGGAGGTENVAIGSGVLGNLTGTTGGGNSNVAIGDGALGSATGADGNSSHDSNNVAVGISALSINKGGSDNTAVGLIALKLNITGNENVAIGEGASQNNLSATSTVAIGLNAAAGGDFINHYNAQGYTVVGYQAGASIRTGSDYNTLIGYKAGSSVTTGFANLVLGTSQTASNLTTGSGNILIGNNAFATTSGSGNGLNIGGLVFGQLPATSTAFKLPTSGSVGVGTSSPFAKFSIHSNNGDTATTLFAIGSSTASATTTLFSISNTGTIHTSLVSCDTIDADSNGNLLCGTDQTSTGAANPFTWSTNYNVVTAATSSAIWAQSGIFASSTSHFVSADFSTGATSSAFAISNIASGNILKTTTGGSLVAAVAGSDYITGAGLAAAFPFTATTNFGTTANSTSTAIWFQNGLQASSTARLSDISTIGILNFASTTFNASSTLISINGQSFLSASTSATVRNLFLGLSAGSNVRSSTNSTGIGYKALFNATSSSAVNNTALGAEALAGNANDSSGGYNTAVGTFALHSNSSGSTNTAIGAGALQFNSSGANTTALGAFAGGQSGGSNDTFVGAGTALLSFGDRSTAVGAAALYGDYGEGAPNTGAGPDNTAIGYSAGGFIDGGYGNTTLGSYAGQNVITGYNNILVGYNTLATSSTAVNTLNIGNFIFGNLPATTSSATKKLTLPTTGSLGVGTSSPFAKFSIHSNNGDTATTLFAIGSSTASATTTLFAITNTGTIDTALTTGCVQSDSSGILSSTGVACGSGGGSYPFALTGNATSTLTQFNGGLTAFASSTIGNGTQTGGLTISGGATTTATSTLAGLIVNSGNVGIGTASPQSALEIDDNSGGSPHYLLRLVNTFVGGGPQEGILFYGPNSTNPADRNWANNTNVNQEGDFAIFSSADNTSLPVSSSGTKLEILSNGNVGLNNDRNPGVTLSVASGNAQIGYAAGQTAPSNGLIVSGSLGVGTSTPWGKFSINNSTSDTGGQPLFVVASSTATATTTLFSISNTGSVLIGTSTNTTLSATNPAFVTIDSGTATSEEGLAVLGNVNDFYEMNVKNLSSGSAAQSCVTATGNTGTLTTNFLSGCVNSTTFNNPQPYNAGFAGDSNLISLANNFYLAQGTSGKNTFILNGGVGTSSIAIAISSTNNNVGIGTTSPFAKFSIQATSTETNTTLFAIASSTASATTTLFSVSNTGTINLKLDASTSTLATFAGQTFLTASTTGFNTGLGLNSLSKTTSGSQNVGLGYSALGQLTTGTQNTAIGSGALSGSAISGSNNTAVGYNSMATANSGNADNTTLGSVTGQNIFGSRNIVIGSNAGFDLNAASGNIVIGAYVDAANNNANAQLNVGNVLFGTGLYNSTTASGAAVTNGNLGVGTSSPFAQFSIHGINGSTNTTLFAVASSTATATSTLFSITNTGSVALGTSTPWALFSLQASTTNMIAGQPLFVVASSSVSGSSVATLFKIDNIGNVGISSTSPNTLLSVGGNAYFGTGTGSTLTFHAGTINYPVTSTSTILNQANSFSIATSTAAGNGPVFSISGNGATSTIMFFGATSTLLNVGGASGVTGAAATLRNYLIVGDGKTNASVAIVKGSLCVDSDGWCVASTTQAGGGGGSIAARDSVRVGNTDLAEMYVSSTTLNKGDIIATDGGFAIRAAQGDTKHKVIGIISSDPGLVLGAAPDDDGRNKYPVGLAGRVPVNVSLQNGPIAVGDRITLSSTPGVGMKAGPFDASVGIALEAYDGTATSSVLAFLTLQQGTDIAAISQALLGTTTPTSTPAYVSASILGSASDALRSVLDDTLAGFALLGQKGVRMMGDVMAASVGIFDKVFASHVYADTVTAHTLCLGDTCVDEQQLKGLLNATSTPQPDPVMSDPTPVIEINGNNPAYVPLHASYSDLGAIITGPTDADRNLGISLLLDGVAVPSIYIDTATTSEYWVTYRATNQGGFVGEARRKVVVYDPNFGQPDMGTATSTDPGDTSTSTPPTP
ncbi:MAG: hypothetical protein V4474_00005 [Patescibacteria group bacterium]